MSTRYVTSRVNSNDVIVRAYADEPKVLKACNKEGNVVTVGNAEGDAYINFPKERIFLFESRLFKRLESAYLNGDKDALERLWKTAHPFENLTAA